MPLQRIQSHKKKRPNDLILKNWRMVLKIELLCIGYMRLIMCLLTIGIFAVLSISQEKHKLLPLINYLKFPMSLVFIVPEIQDFIFTGVLIAAIHKGNIRLYLLYLGYSAVLCLVYSVVMLLVVWDQKRYHLWYPMLFQYAWFHVSSHYIDLVFGTFIILLQLFLMHVVRNQVLYLRKRTRTERKLKKANSRLLFSGVPTYLPSTRLRFNIPNDDQVLTV